MEDYSTWTIEDWHRRDREEAEQERADRALVEERARKTRQGQWMVGGLFALWVVWTGIDGDEPSTADRERIADCGHYAGPASDC